MQDRLERPMRAADFLRWSTERSGTERWELSNGVPISMAAERNRHNLLKTEIALELGLAIRRVPGGGCRLFGDGVSVVIDEYDVYEPDAAVQCGGTIDLDATTVDAPVVIVEVLSPSTAYRDTGEKLEAYLGLPSLRHYLVFDPVRRVAVHHGRETADAPVVTSIHHGGTLDLPPTGLALDLGACFAALPADPAQD